MTSMSSFSTPGLCIVTGAGEAAIPGNAVAAANHIEGRQRYR